MKKLKLISMIPFVIIYSFITSIIFIILNMKKLNGKTKIDVIIEELKEFGDSYLKYMDIFYFVLFTLITIYFLNKHFF